MLIIDGVCKRFGARKILDGFSLQLEAGMIGCLLGPSGSGKTTALRLVAGFEQPDAGTITVAGVPVATPERALPPYQRPIGMVFQDYALFPHLTVAKNIAFGLRHWPRAARAERVASLLALVALSDAAEAYPHELSGGQQQRVALARSLAPKPQLLLLDEPFSNLDATLREHLAAEVRRILKAEAVTALVVTHDQSEAFALADRLGVLEAGRIAQWDSAYGLYHQPKTRFVADFIGEGAFLPGTITDNGMVATPFGLLPCRPGTLLPTGRAVEVLLRPDDLAPDEASPIAATLEQALFRGSTIRYTLRLPTGATVLMDHPSHDPLPVGSRIGVRLDVRHVVVFPSDGRDEKR